MQTIAAWHLPVYVCAFLGRLFRSDRLVPSLVPPLCAIVPVRFRCGRLFLADVASTLVSQPAGDLPRRDWSERDVHSAVVAVVVVQVAGAAESGCNKERNETLQLLWWETLSSLIYIYRLFSSRCRCNSCSVAFSSCWKFINMSWLFSNCWINWSLWWIEFNQRAKKKNNNWLIDIFASLYFEHHRDIERILTIDEGTVCVWTMKSLCVYVLNTDSMRPHKRDSCLVGVSR